MLLLGHTPSTAGTFRKKFRENSGKTPETLSELFLEFPLRVRLGSPKPCNSRHLKAPEHFQNCHPLSTAGDASSFRSGSGEGLSELLMEFPPVLGAFLSCSNEEELFAIASVLWVQKKPAQSSGQHLQATRPVRGKSVVTIPLH